MEQKYISLANDMLTFAKTLLERDGGLQPVVFILKEGFAPAVEQLEIVDEAQKEQMFVALGCAAAKSDIDALLFINEGWLRRVDASQLDKDDFQYESPSMYPESMREECIVATLIDFKESKGYSSFTIFTRENGFKFKDSDGFDEAKGMTTEVTLNAYNQASALLSQQKED